MTSSACGYWLICVAAVFLCPYQRDKAVWLQRRDAWLFAAME
jgi:hypothetical protein